MTRLIARDALGELTKLGQGGQGIVYQAPKVKAKFANAMVFKEYKPHIRREVNFEALSAMSDLVTNTLPNHDGQGLISIAAWPCALVESDTGPVGFIMPAIPDSFFMDLTTVKGRSRTTSEFQHLLNTTSVLTARGITVTNKQRYQLVREVAKGLSFLHRIGVCVGDISPKNVLFTLNPRPAVYFVDCDAMRVNGVSALPQMETPEWQVPPGEELATIYSDTYKLGLLALRLLVGDQHTRNPQDLPPTTPKPLRQLVTDTLNKEPDHRPLPEAWAYLLDHVVDEAKAQSPDSVVALATATPPIYALEPTPVVRSRTPSRTSNGAPSATALALTSDQKRYIYAAAAVFGAIAIGAIATNGFQGSNSSSSRSTPSTNSSAYTTTPAAIATAPFFAEDPTNRIVRTAAVGECIHRTAPTKQNPDGSYDVTVSSAVCGTEYSTDRVTLRTYDKNSCGVGGWVRDNDPPIIYLCLERN